MSGTLNGFQESYYKHALVQRKNLTALQEKTEGLGALYRIIQENNNLPEMLVAVCDGLALDHNISEHQHLGSKLLTVISQAGIPDSLQALVFMVGEKLGSEADPFFLAKIVHFLMVQISHSQTQNMQEKIQDANAFLAGFYSKTQIWDKDIEPGKLTFSQENAYHLAKKILAGGSHPFLGGKNEFSHVLDTSKTQGSLFFACQKYVFCRDPQIISGVVPSQALHSNKTATEILEDIAEIKKDLLALHGENAGQCAKAFFGILTLVLDGWFDVHRKDPTHGPSAEKAIFRKIQDKENYLNAYFDTIPTKAPLFERLQSALNDARLLKDQDPTQAKNLMENIPYIIKKSCKKNHKPSSNLFKTLQQEMTDFEFSLRKQKELFFRYDKMISAYSPHVNSKQREKSHSFLISEKELRIAEKYAQTVPTPSLSIQFKREIFSYYRSQDKKESKKNPNRGVGASSAPRDSGGSYFRWLCEVKFRPHLTRYYNYKVPFIKTSYLKALKSDYGFRIDFSRFPYKYKNQHVICRAAVELDGYPPDNDGYKPYEVFIPIYFDGQGKPKKQWEEKFSIPQFTEEIEKLLPALGDRGEFSISASKLEQWVEKGDQVANCAPRFISSQLGWHPLLCSIVEEKNRDPNQFQEVLTRCGREQSYHLLFQETLWS